MGECLWQYGQTDEAKEIQRRVEEQFFPGAPILPMDERVALATGDPSPHVERRKQFRVIEGGQPPFTTPEESE